MRTRTALYAAALSVATLAATAAPASANVKRFEDPVGDSKAHNDIRWVVLNNGGPTGERLQVRIRMTDVQYGDQLRVFVDTRSNNPGPEWRMTAYPDSEWVLHRVDTWDSPGTVTYCPGRVRFTEPRDIARWRTSRDCLSVGDKVRVAVRVQEGSSPQHDWARAYRMFLGWVAR